MMNNQNPDYLPSFQEEDDQVNRRKERIAAGDLKLKKLQSKLGTASDAWIKVQKAEIAEAHERAAKSPEFSACWTALAELYKYELELDAAREHEEMLARWSQLWRFRFDLLSVESQSQSD